MRNARIEDLKSDQPLYVQLIELFRNNIKSGQWPVHTKLRDEINLSHELGVSRGTLRRAIRELVRQGVLSQVKGRGTFVVSNRVEQALATRLISFSEAMEEQGLAFETQVISVTREIPSPQIRALLEIGGDKIVYDIRRVRTAAGKPIIYLQNFVPIDVLPRFRKSRLEKEPLFRLIENSGKHPIDWGRRYFRAVAADAIRAERLGVSSGFPLLFLEQIVYSTRSRPLECSHVWINTEEFDIVAILTR